MTRMYIDCTGTLESLRARKQPPEFVTVSTTPEQDAEIARTQADMMADVEKEKADKAAKAKREAALDVIAELLPDLQALIAKDKAAVK